MIEVEKLLVEQEKLPLKIRYKSEFIRRIFLASFDGVENLFHKNWDFLKLDENEKILLIEENFDEAVGLNRIFALRRWNIFQRPKISKTIESLCGSKFLDFVRILTRKLTDDELFVTLMVHVIIFSPKNDSKRFSLISMRRIFHIQNKYVELSFKYLTETYGYQVAVRLFSNFLETFFMINRWIEELYQNQIFCQTRNFIIDRIHKSLSSWSI